MLVGFVFDTEPIRDLVEKIMPIARRSNTPAIRMFLWERKIFR